MLDKLGEAYIKVVHPYIEYRSKLYSRVEAAQLQAGVALHQFNGPVIERLFGVGLFKIEESGVEMNGGLYIAAFE